MENIIEQVCCLCLTKNLKDSIDIFGETGNQLKVEPIINQHFKIQLQNSDDNHDMICYKCWTVTNSFHQLYTKVKKKNIELFSKSIIILKDVTEENYLFEHVKKEENDNNYDQPPAKESEEKFIVKAEPLLVVNNLNVDCHSVDLNDNDDDGDVDGEDDDDDNDDDYDGNKDDTVDDYDPIGDCSDNGWKKILRTKRKLPKKIDKDSEDNFDGKIKKKRKQTHEKLGNQQKQTKLNTNKTKSKEEIDLENQQISNYFKMTCDLCNENLVHFLDARSHYNRVHQQIGYLICCNKKFHRRSRILDHINRHLNPDAYKCPECNKMYVDKQALQKHMEHHLPIDQRPFKCDICSSSFTKLFKLSQHMRLTHCNPSDKIFQCAECDKCFITKSILTTHIRGVHEFAYAHVCHICAKTFKSKQVYELHQREHMDIEVPKVQCKICGAWLKHEHSLRKHMYRHSDGEAICTVCNKVTSNKEALRSHMRNVHKERTHLCTLCEKAFIKARSLKEHMATHTGEDIYTCSYCPITFKSSANMHSHQKKMHLDEWLLAKAKRQKP